MKNPKCDWFINVKTCCLKNLDAKSLIKSAVRIPKNRLSFSLKKQLLKVVPNVLGLFYGCQKRKPIEKPIPTEAVVLTDFLNTKYKQSAFNKPFTFLVLVFLIDIHQIHKRIAR